MKAKNIEYFLGRIALCCLMTSALYLLIVSDHPVLYARDILKQPVALVWFCILSISACYIVIDRIFLGKFGVQE